MGNLRSKSALISGGSKGIGKEIAYSLASKGVNLLLLGRDEVSLKKIRTDLENQVKIDYYLIDFTKEGQFSLFFDYIMKINYKPDILIHSAGYFSHCDVDNITENELDNAYCVNFKAPFLLTGNLLPQIAENKGEIVFINSTASITPKAKSSAYSSYKSALKTFADVLRKEVNIKGVRVLSIYPGRVNTNMQLLATRLEGIKYEPDKYLNPKEIANIVVRNLEFPPEVDVSDIIVRPSQVNFHSR